MDTARKRCATELRWQRKFMEKKKMFTGKKNLELKKRIMKCLVWSVALHAADVDIDADKQKIRNL